MHASSDASSSSSCSLYFRIKQTMQTKRLWHLAAVSCALQARWSHLALHPRLTLIARLTNATAVPGGCRWASCCCSASRKGRQRWWTCTSTQFSSGFCFSALHVHDDILKFYVQQSVFTVVVHNQHCLHLQFVLVIGNEALYMYVGSRNTICQPRSQTLYVCGKVFMCHTPSLCHTLI